MDDLLNVFQEWLPKMNQQPENLWGKMNPAIGPMDGPSTWEMLDDRSRTWTKKKEDDYLKNLSRWSSVYIPTAEVGGGGPPSVSGEWFAAPIDPSAKGDPGPRPSWVNDMNVPRSNPWANLTWTDYSKDGKKVLRNGGDPPMDSNPYPELGSDYQQPDPPPLPWAPPRQAVPTKTPPAKQAWNRPGQFGTYQPRYAAQLPQNYYPWTWG